MDRLPSRGILTGIFAALLAFLFARIFGASQVDLSIAYEAHQVALAHDVPEQELLTRLPARSLSLWLAGVCFIIAVRVPDLKYSSNPPAVGLPETINLRIVSYFTMLALPFCSAAIGILDR